MQRAITEEPFDVADDELILEEVLLEVNLREVLLEVNLREVLLEVNPRGSPRGVPSS